MIANDDGSYDSMSEDEMEAIEHVAMHRQVNDEEDAQVYCDNDSSPALVVSKVLTLQHQQGDDQRCHIFHTKANINGSSVKVIMAEGFAITWQVKSYVATAIGQEEEPSPLQGSMAKRLRNNSSGAHRACFFQDRRLRGHHWVRRGSYVRVPSSSRKTLAIGSRHHPQRENKPL